VPKAIGYFSERSRINYMMTYRTLLVLLVIAVYSEAAKRCYSGSKDKYESRPCDTGVDGKYVCQKFNCEGGRSPFILRTCANKNMGCLAGPAICKFSGGSGSCSRCETDNCNL
uniref:Conserved secreted protein n=1 Tax=Haemonchus contortus TaxID=6289 RepID=A0A7I4YYS0_HAECO